MNVELKVGDLIKVKYREIYGYIKKIHNYKGLHRKVEVVNSYSIHILLFDNTSHGVIMPLTRSKIRKLTPKEQIKLKGKRIVESI